MRFLKGVGVFLFGVVAASAGAAAVARRVVESRGDSESAEVALAAIFDGIELESRAQAFRGGSMLAWYGGIEADLREAQLASNAHLRVRALLGGIAIRVPPGWRVESHVKAILGGVAVQVPPVDAEGSPTLTLDGFALLGGIAVAARRGAGETGSGE